MGKKKVSESTIEILSYPEMAEKYLEIAGEIILVLDINGKISRINRKGEKILGWSKDDLVGKNWFKTCLPKRVQKNVQEMFDDIIAGKIKLYENVEEVVFTKDGEERLIDWHNTVLRDSDDNIIGTLSSGTDITERLRAEEALRSQNEFLNTTIDSLIHPFYVINVDDYNVVLANTAANFGKLDSDSKCYRLTHGQDEPCHTDEHKCPMEIIKETKEAVSLEHIHYDEEGNERIVEIHSYPIFNGSGELSQIIEYNVDITERKQAEEALKDSEERYCNLVESLNDVIFNLDLEGNFTYISPVIEKLSGYKSGEIVNRPFMEYVHPDDLNGVLKSMEKTISGELEPYEFRVLDKAGEVRHVRTFSRINLEDGKPVDLTGIMTDITDQKRAEEAIRQNEEKYRSIIVNAIDATFSVGLDRKLRFVNDFLIGWSGYKKEEIIGREIDLLFHPEDALIALEAEKRGRAGEVYEFEMRVVTKDGIVGWGSFFNWPIFNEDGSIAEIQGIIRDVTDKKRAEEELIKSEERYRELFDNMSSGVAVYEVKDGGKDFVFKDFNKAGERIYGDKREDLIGKSIFDVRPGVEDFGLIDVFRRVWKTSNPEYHPVTLYKDERLNAWYENYVYKLSSDEIVAVFDNITERKQAEEALKESEERNRFTLDAIPDMVYELALDGMVLYANKSSSEILGYSLDRLGEINISDLIDKEGLNFAFNEIGMMIKTKMPSQTMRYNLKTADGHFIPVETIIIPIEDKDKTLTLLGVARDITERMRADEILKESEDKYRNLVNSIDDIIYIVDDKGKIKFINDAIERTMDYKIGELIDKNFMDIIVPESQEYALEISKGQLADEYVGVFERKFYNKRGQIQIFEIREKFIWEDNRVVEVHGIGRDITDRKRAEEALQESEEKFRNLFESSMDVVYLSSLEGKFVEINQSGEELLGYTRDELLEMDILDIFNDSNDRKKFQETIKKQGFVKDYEVFFKNKDGTPIECLVTATLRREESGSIIGYQGIIRDISGKKRLEEQIIRTQKMEAIGELAGGIAHDFNNILAIIMVNASYLISKADKGNVFYEKLKSIEDSSVLASELSSQILSFSRKGKLELKPVDMNWIVKETYDFISNTFSKSIKIIMKPERNLKNVEGDKSQLSQILMNLTINSRDAMPTGGTLWIQTYSKEILNDNVKEDYIVKSGSYVCVKITDTGVGMDDNTLKRIFEPYFTTKKDKGGTGLGTSVVYGIVKSHQGYIDVKSVQGKGTDIVVYLPATEKEIDIRERKIEEIRGGLGTILVIDDEKKFLYNIKDVLTDYGYKVYTSSSGKTGLRTYRSKLDSIDMVILDIDMPYMDGINVFARLLEIDPGVKVLFCSGHSEENLYRELIQMGALFFIEKPFVINSLLSKIKEVLI